MDKILCQSKHSESGGCANCGGYGYLLVKETCASCGTEYWDRNRDGSTIYNGKVIRCFDGTKIKVNLPDLPTCSHCEDLSGL